MKKSKVHGERPPSTLQIDASSLKAKLDRGEDVFILDVRTPEEYKAWRLSYGRHKKTPLIPVDKLVASQKLIADQIPKDKEIVTLCAHGNRSMMAAQMLSRLGYNAKSIKGGMSAWNQVYDIAEVPLPDAVSSKDNKLKLWQLRRVSKGCMTYVIASGKSATVIDCTCDLDNSVLQLAKDHGLEIVSVVDTHMHADHVSGLSALARRTGGQAYISAEEGYNLPRDREMQLNLVSDGDKIPIGNGTFMTAVLTPGHTKGGMSLAFAAGSRRQNPNYLFTGDTLFVDGVGRPDLRDKAKEFAKNLYETYRNKILKCPDNTVVLPAHFDPGLITLNHGELIMGTIGSAKKNVKLLSLPKDEFVDFMVSSVPPRPANYKMITQMNSKLVPCDQINMGDLEAGPNACAIRM